MDWLFFRSDRLATAASRTSTSLSSSSDANCEGKGSVEPARLSAIAACLRVSGFLSLSAFSRMSWHCRSRVTTGAATGAGALWQIAIAGQRSETSKVFRIHSPQEICSSVYDRSARCEARYELLSARGRFVIYKLELVRRSNGFKACFPVHFSGIGFLPDRIRNRRCLSGHLARQGGDGGWLGSAHRGGD